MGDEVSKNEIAREDVIAAAQLFVAKGVKNPDELLDSKEEEAQKLWQLHDDWVQQESKRIETLPFDDAIRARIAIDTLWYDAGFTGVDILDEIAGDWLVNALGDADHAHRRNLANEVKAKIREIQEKIKEQDPTYEIQDLDSADWNPSRAASSEEFYADYAYFTGPEQATIEDAVSKYLNFHPDADSAEVKKEMERAAQEYTES